MGLPLMAMAPAAMNLLGMGISAFGAKKGTDAANSADKYNRKINERDFKAAQRAREESIAFAKMLRGEDQLGVTDANGNRVYFDPERGWVTELTPLQKQINENIQNEQLRQSDEGAMRSGMAEERMSNLAQDSATRARAAGQEFDRVQRQDPDEIASMLMARGQGARNQAQDRLMEGVNRAMVRGGNTSNFGDMVSSQATNDAEAARTAAIDSKLQAMNFVDAKYNADRGGAASLMDQFSRGASYSPQFQMSMATGPAGQQSRQGSSALLSAMSGQPPQQDYIQPNFAGANAWGGAGQAITGFGGYLQGKQDTDKLLAAFQGMNDDDYGGRRMT